MNEYLVVFGALLTGLAMRTLLPYIVVGLNAISEGGFGAWPKFEAKYLASLGLAVIGYGVTLVTVPGAVEALLEMTFVAIVAMAYAGEDLVRQAIKLLVPRLR